ncbi:MAG: hypothetical protein ACJ71P_06795 [Nitrososphaeraceae archaeon]
MCPSQNEQNRQEEHDDGKNNILTREIDSWSNLVCSEGGKQTPV